MKIGFIIDDTLDSSDGVQQYVLLIGGWLKGQGHDVHYLAGQTKRQDVANIHSLARNVRVAFNKNILSIPLPASAKKIKHILQTEKFDVLHVQMPYSPLFAAKVITNAPPRTAIVGTFHIAPHTKFVSRATHALAKIQKKSLARLDHLISVSPVAQAFARQAFGLESQVIPNAVDISQWKPGKAIQREQAIVFIGRLVERKGAIHLIKAFQQMQTQHPDDTKLIIAGDGPQRDRLQQYVMDSNLQSKVSFLGYISEEKKRSLLHSCKLAVYPSTGGESFGIVLIEAMAAGIVTLGGNNAGYRAVLAETPEAVFSPRETTELVQILRKLLTNARQYKSLQNKQSSIIKSYDVNIVGNDILNIYKQAIKEQKDRHAKS